MPVGHSGTPLARQLGIGESTHLTVIALPLGGVDVKVCAVTAVWSGLKLVVRKELRPYSPAGPEGAATRQGGDGGTGHGEGLE
jgi:hypothetical protein